MRNASRITHCLTIVNRGRKYFHRSIPSQTVLLHGLGRLLFLYAFLPLRGNILRSNWVG